MLRYLEWSLNESLAVLSVALVPRCRTVPLVVVAAAVVLLGHEIGHLAALFVWCLYMSNKVC